MPLVQEDYLLIPPAIYIPITYVLYVTIIYVINFSSTRKKYSSGFFKLYTWHAVSGMVQNLTVTLWLRVSHSPLFVPFMGLLPQRHFILTLLPFLAFLTTYSLLLLDVAMAFNRFTVFFLKTGYDRFWRTGVPVSLVLVLTISVALTWNFWATDVAILPEQVNETTGQVISYFYDQHDKKRYPFMDNNLFTFIMELVVSILSLFMNLYVAFNLIFMKGKNASINKTEYKLFMYTFFNSSCFMLECFAQILIYFRLTYGVLGTIVYSGGIFFIDFATLGSGWFMIAINSSLRNDVLRKVGVNMEESTMVVSVIQDKKSTMHKSHPTGSLFTEPTKRPTI